MVAQANVGKECVQDYISMVAGFVGLCIIVPYCWHFVVASIILYTI
jgi:uncharacterized membrane protein